MTTAMATNQTQPARLPAWQQYLDSKGILQEALDLGWRVKGKYIEYDLTKDDGSQFFTTDNQHARRYVLWDKRALADDMPRFYFKPKKPEGDTPKENYLADWYTPSGVWESAKIRNGRLIIACGESDMLSFRAAGAPNVVTLYGEQNIPANLPQRIKNHGIVSVHYYPDLDAAGITAACNMAILFARAEPSTFGLKFAMHKLPASIGSAAIKDANDVWIAVGKDAQAFKNTITAPYDLQTALTDLTNIGLADEKSSARLKGLINKWKQNGNLEWIQLRRDLELIWKRWEAAGVMPAPVKAKTDATEPEGDIPAGLWEQIEFIAGVQAGATIEYKDGGDGWSQNIPCPVSHHEHDRSAPGFALHRATHSAKCQKGCGTGGWKWLCEHYKIDYREFLPKPAPASYLPATEPTQSETLPIGTITVEHLHENPVETAPVNLPAPAPAPTSAVARMVSSKNAAIRAAEQAALWARNPTECRGLSLGLGSAIDRALHGVWSPPDLPEGDLMGFIARTGVGKSTLLLQLALHLGMMREIIFVSPEMTPELMIHRAAAMLYGLRWDDVLAGQAGSGVELTKMYNQIAESRKNISFSEDCSLADLLEIGQYAAKTGAVLFVDSIQNIAAPEKKTKLEEITAIMGALESISKRVPTLMSIQANRGAAERSNKSPIPSDALYGGDIERKLKRMISLWSPYYDKAIGEVDDESEQDESKRKKSTVAHHDPNAFYAKVIKDRLTARIGTRWQLCFPRDGEYGIRPFDDIPNKSTFSPDFDPSEVPFD